MSQQPMKKVICQKWEESERGWGTRPDGYTLHLDRAALAAFVKIYWDKMPGKAPDEYSRPDGTPYELEVDDETYAKVEQAKDKHGIWCSGTPKGNQGPDGWRSLSK